MHKPSPQKEMYDPYYHYTRGVLYFDEDHFTFTAYRVPYQGLDNKSWETEQAFKADYRRAVEKKYSV
ncbi:MAG: hypothetical protein QNK19_16505 [Xanthomonadales bacterium]|nr:hypothetical protein [Xanthomonadales bacterium]